MKTVLPLSGTPKTKEFVNYIHNFRGLAILFVVAGHLLMDWDKNSFTYLLFRVFWENGTVLFVFIAGYLFQYLSKNFSYPDYLRKKLKNVLLPYLLISMPIIIYRILKVDYPGYILIDHPDIGNWAIINQIIYFYLHGSHMQQLWFVPMISIFYIFAPILIAIDRHPKWYLLLLFFIPLSLIVKREPFTDIIRMFVHFISVYLFGMLMSRYRKEYLEIAKKYWGLISLFFLLIFILNVVYFDSHNGMLNYFQKLVLCAFSIYWLWRLDKFVPPFFATLAELSFGIFFMHYYFILILKAVYEFQYKTPIPGNVLNWLFYFIFVVILNIIFLKIVKTVFKTKSRYLVGC